MVIRDDRSLLEEKDRRCPKRKEVMAVRGLMVRSSLLLQWLEWASPPWGSQVRFGAAQGWHGGGGPSRSVVEGAVVEAQQPVAQAVAFAAPLHRDNET